MLLLLLLVSTVFATPDKLEEILAWSQVSFQWPNEESRFYAQINGDYVPENNLPLGLEVWKDKLFVTVPRWRKGVASTLNYVQLPVKSANATLVPYPDWKSNTLPKCEETVNENTIVSTLRVKVDACDRLWMVDDGALQLNNGEKIVIRKPAVVVYDLRTDKLLRRYQLKKSDYNDGSMFTNIAVDVNKTHCEDAFAYMADSMSTGCGLVVYSWKLNESWKVRHNYFHMDPLKGNFVVGGVNFQWPTCVLGIALGPVDENNYRTAYFHSFSSTTEFSVNTEVLTNKSLALDSHSFDLFKVEGRTGENTQSATEVFDEESNVLFLTQIQRDGLACWNPRQPLEPDNVALVANDKDELIFTNDLKIDENRNLWILSNKLSLFDSNTMNQDEINFRIFKAKIDGLINGTVCDA